MKPTLRLFVSSTFKDFESERRELNCYVFPALTTLLKEKNVGFLPIDLRWGVTEGSAKNGRTMEICHLEVERACNTEPPPDFLLLVGNRYGWRPLPSVIAKEDFICFSGSHSILKSSYELDSNTTETLLGECDGVYRLKRNASPNDEATRSALDLAVSNWYSNYKKIDKFFKTVFYAGSATHQEFEIAKTHVATAKNKGQILIYLNNSRSHVSYDDTTPQYLKGLGLGIEAFRKSVNSLTSVIILNDWEKTKSHIQDLPSLFNIQAQENNPATDTQHSEIFIRDRCLTLVAREKEVKELIDFCAKGHGVKAVVGESGSGKSTLLAGLIDSLRGESESLPDIRLIYRFIGVDQNVGSERDLLASLIRELGGLVPLSSKDYEAAFRDSIAATKAQKVILILDAVNQLLGEAELRWLSDLPVKVCVVVSMIEEDTRFPSQLKVTCVPDPLAVVSEHLKKFGRVLSPNQSNEIEIKLSGKSALHLVMIAGALRDLRGGESIQIIPDSVPDMLNQLHEWLSERHMSHVIDRVFSLLLVTKYGVSEVEIREVLEKDEQLRSLLRDHAYHPLQQEDPLPPILLSSLWEDIRPYISIRQRHGEDLLSFFHPAFENHFSNTYSLEDSAQLLSNYYLEILHIDINATAIEEHVTPRILEEVIGVLVKAQSDVCCNFIEKLLTNLEYIQQRCALSSTEVYNLIDDYSLVLDNWTEDQRSSSISKRTTNGIDSRCVMESRSAGRVELAFQFVMECRDALSFASQCPTVAVEQAHRRSRTGLLAEMADTKLHEWKSKSSKRFVEYLIHSRPIRGDVNGDHILEGHEGFVNSIAITDNKSILISAGADSTVKVWNIKNGRPLRSLNKHKGSVGHVALIPDTTHVISASNDNTLIVWNYEDGSIIHQLPGHSRIVRHVAVTFDGKRAVSSDGAGLLKVWDLEQGHCYGDLLGHETWAPVSDVAVTPDGTRAVSASHDKTLIVWDLDTLKCQFILEGHQGEVTKVIIASNGKMAVSASKDNSIKVWDLDLGCIIHTLKGHSKEITSVVLTADGKLAVSGSEDKSIKVWNLEEGVPIHTFSEHSKEITCVALTPDGKRVLSASLDNTLKMWDLVSKKFICDISRSVFFVSHIKIASSGSSAVTSSNSGNINIWNIKKDCKPRTSVAPAHNWTVNNVALNSFRRRAVSSSVDGSMKVWDLNSGECLKELSFNYPQSLALTSNGELGIYAEESKTLKAVNLVTGDNVFFPSGSGFGYVAHIGLTTDGKFAVSACDDCTLKLWDLVNKKFSGELIGHTSRVRHVAITPDGKSAVSASDDKTLIVWDLMKLKIRRMMKRHSGIVCHVAVTPDGIVAISASVDKTLKFWNLASGELICTLEGHEVTVRVVITPDGKRAVSAGSDGAIKVWNLQNGELCAEIHRHGGGKSILTNLNLKTSLLVTPDGRYVISLGFDRILKIWNLEDGCSELTFFARPGWICVGSKPTLIGCELDGVNLRFYKLDLGLDEIPNAIYCNLLSEQNQICFICPSCGERNDGPEEAIKCINGIMMEYPEAYAYSASPCRILPEVVWETNGLLRWNSDINYVCRCCDSKLRFNPWIVGWDKVESFAEVDFL